MSAQALRRGAPMVAQRRTTMTEKVAPAGFDAEKVTVDQTQWPEEFRQFDTADPMKNSPTTTPFTSWGLVSFAFMLQFVLVFGEGEAEFAWVDAYRKNIEG